MFINNGDLTFTEKAAEYGLANVGLSNHAAFFDYDRDGDLDCYLLNNSFQSVTDFDMKPGNARFAILWEETNYSGMIMAILWM